MKERRRNSFGKATYLLPSYSHHYKGFVGNTLLVNEFPSPIKKTTLKASLYEPLESWNIAPHNLSSSISPEIFVKLLILLNWVSIFKYFLNVQVHIMAEKDTELAIVNNALHQDRKKTKKIKLISCLHFSCSSFRLYLSQHFIR